MNPSPRSRFALLALSSLVWARPTAAAEPQTPSALRWPDVAAALERHPLVLEAEAARQGAAGAVSSAGSLPNPVFTGTAGEARGRDGAPSGRTWSLGVTVPLDPLATRGARVSAAEAAEEATRHEATGARPRALRELRRAFVAAVHGAAVVEAAAELEGQVAQLAGLVRRRAERGEARPTEVPRIEIEQERLEGALERARAMAEGARQRLAAAAGLEVGRLEADLSLGPALPPLDALRGRVLSESPVLRGARARVEAAASAARAERWERFPKLALEGTRTEEPERRATTVGATVALPLWNWNGGRIRQADAALEAERARLDAATRELAASLGEAWQGCSAGQAGVRRFREEILPRAERSARALGRAFELGEAGLLDVIDARRTFLDTRREALDQQLEMQNACADLAAMAGLEMP